MACARGKRWTRVRVCWHARVGGRKKRNYFGNRGRAKTALFRGASGGHCAATWRALACIGAPMLLLPRLLCFSKFSKLNWSCFLADFSWVIGCYLMLQLKLNWRQNREQLGEEKGAKTTTKKREIRGKIQKIDFIPCN